MTWTPQPHEADLFCNVYIDESSQNKHRFLVLGGLIVPLSHAEIFDADIISARDQIISPVNANGDPRVIKWEKVSAYNLESYKKVVDAYFTFLNRHKTPIRKHVDIHCVVVDTQKKSLKLSGEGNIDIGFNKEIYFLCVPVIGKRYKEELFHIYPDRRTTSQPLDAARRIMNYGAKKYGDRRIWPYRRMRFEDPERCQALQVVDIFIGALAYRLNGHYDKPEANPAKKQLSDYILNRAKITNPFERSAYYRRRFTVTHRDGQPFAAKR